MKAKLLKIKVCNKGYSDREGYEDIIEHIVTTHSDFEEVEDHSALVRFVKDFNSNPNNPEGDYYLIAYETTPINVKSAIKDIIERENKVKQEAWRKEEAKRAELKAKYEAGAAKRAEKKRAKLEKQLAHLQKQLEDQKLQLTKDAK